MASPERLVSQQQPSREDSSQRKAWAAGADEGTNSRVAGVISAGALRNEVYPAADAARPSRGWRSPGLASTSSCRLTSVACCHQFKISGFGLARSLGTGLRLCSDAFTAGDCQFRLEVFPGGAAAERTQHLSIFLTSTGGGGSRDLLYEVAILDQSGKGRHLVRSCRPQPGPPAATGGDAEASAVVAGWPAFVRAALLEAHAARYLLGDRLVVRARVEVLHSWVVPPERLLPAPGQAALLLPPAPPTPAGVTAADGRTGAAAEPCSPVNHTEQQQQAATTTAAGPAVDARSTAADAQAALLNQLGLLSLLQPGLEALQQQARRACWCPRDTVRAPPAAAVAAGCTGRLAAGGSSDSGAMAPASPNAQQQQARSHQPAKQSAPAAAAGPVIISPQPPGSIGSSNDSCSSQLAAAACAPPRLLLLPAVYEAQALQLLSVQQQLLQQLLASCQRGGMDGSAAGCSHMRGPLGPHDEHPAADAGTALSTAQPAGSNCDGTSAAPPAKAGGHASLSADAGARKGPADVQPADGAE